MKKMKITFYHSESAAMGFFQETRRLVRNNHSKQVISVRATEVLLYFIYCFMRLLGLHDCGNYIFDDNVGLTLCAVVRSKTHFFLSDVWLKMINQYCISGLKYM